MSIIHQNTLLDCSSFIRSLTIQERYQFFNEQSKLQDLKLNEEALQEWQERKRVINDDQFEDLLKLNEYDINIFSHAVDDNYENNIKELSLFVKEKSWFKELNYIFSHDSIEKVNYNPDFNYGYMIRPFIIEANQKLINVFDSNSKLEIEIDLIEQLLEGLASKLITIADKTLILEINISKLKNELIGESPEERFHYFFEHKGSLKELVNFYNEYCVLARILLNEMRQFVKNIEEIVLHCIESSLELSEWLPKGDIFKIKSLQFGEGDTHQQGKSVAIITLSSNYKIVYKPKKLQIVNAYQALIDRLNKESSLLDIKLAPNIIKDTYTFEKFIEHSSCSTEAEVRNYYQRFGQTLGLMYMLHGNDLHMENVIAAGEYPYVVDIETIFQTLISYNHKNSAELKSRYKMQHWVNNTLLLPEKIIHNEKGDLIEVSALSGQEQTLTKKGYRLSNNYTDKVRYELASLKLGGSNNLTTINGNVVDYKNYIEYIIKGFENVLLFFKENSQELLSTGGFIDQFQECTIRLIIRNTHIYVEFLSNLYHPDCMRDYYYLEQALENLWVLPIQQKKLILTEYKDMLRGDIPIYFTKTNSLSVFDSEMNEFTNVLHKTGLEQVKHKIQSLSDEDIKRQITIIRVKTETVPDDQNKPIRIFPHKITNNKESIRQKFLEEAIKIGEQLACNAIICEESKTMSWLTIKDDEHSFWNVGPVSGELYEGLSGISLFYHYLYVITKENQFKKYRDYCFNMAMKNVMHSKYNSGFTGYASLIYPALKVLQFGPGKKYKQAMQEVLDYLKQAMDINGIDWLHGKSSVIELLLLCYDEQKDEEYLEIACLYGDSLIQEYKQDPSKYFLGGIAHGYSGLAVSLLKLGKYSENAMYTDFGLEMLKYDQTLYDEVQKGWIDQRENSRNVRHFWCNGTVGIGLSRLKIQHYIGSNFNIENDIHKALDTLSDINLLNDDGLCHGNMGLIDFYLELYLSDKKDEHYNQALCIGETLLKDKTNKGIYHLKQFDGFLPIGLFKGLSGIGYEYLRLYNPKLIPSVLTLN